MGGLENKKTPLQANGSMDYEGMAKHIKYLLDASWGKDWGRFSPDGPNVTDSKNVEFPVIIHYLNEMRPGVVGKSTREMKPRYRYTGLVEDANGHHAQGMTIYGQVFDAEVIFEIWGETNAEADRMAKQFRQTISTFAGFLKEKGLKEIQFVKMEADLSNARIRDSHKIRKLTYFVRFEELTEVPTDIFRVLDVVDKQLQEETENGI